MINKRTWGKSDLKYDPVENVCWYIDSKRGITRCYGMPTYGLSRERIPYDEKRQADSLEKKYKKSYKKG